MDHGLELGDGAVGQGLPQVQHFDHSQAAQLLRRPGLPQLLGLSKGSPKTAHVIRHQDYVCPDWKDQRMRVRTLLRENSSI